VYITQKTEFPTHRDADFVVFGSDADDKVGWFYALDRVPMGAQKVLYTEDEDMRKHFSGKTFMTAEKPAELYNVLKLAPENNGREPDRPVTVEVADAEGKEKKVYGDKQAAQVSNVCTPDLQGRELAIYFIAQSYFNHAGVSDCGRMTSSHKKTLRDLLEFGLNNYHKKGEFTDTSHITYCIPCRAQSSLLNYMKTHK
jgi:hypothetical protein